MLIISVPSRLIPCFANSMILHQSLLDFERIRARNLADWDDTSAYSLTYKVNARDAINPGALLWCSFPWPLPHYHHNGECYFLFAGSPRSCPSPPFSEEGRDEGLSTFKLTYHSTSLRIKTSDPSYSKTHFDSVYDIAFNPNDPEVFSIRNIRIIRATSRKVCYLSSLSLLEIGGLFPNPLPGSHASEYHQPSALYSSLINLYKPSTEFALLQTIVGGYDLADWGDLPQRVLLLENYTALVRKRAINNCFLSFHVGYCRNSQCIVS